MTERRGRLFALAVVLSLTVPATAAQQQPDAPAERESIQLDASSEAALRERVSMWWTARVKLEHQQMYDLFEPGYRAKVPFNGFLKESMVTTRIGILAHRITSLEAESAERAIVWLEYDLMFAKFGKPVTGTARDEWVLVSDEWFKVHEPPQVPFPVQQKTDQDS